MTSPAPHERRPTVVVTGADGFIGSAIVTTLRHHRVDALGINRLGSGPGTLETSLDDIEALANELREAGITTACHCAWTGNPRSAGLDHAAQVRDNIVPALNLGLACGLAGVSQVVFLSSGGGRSVRRGEELPPAYGWAKAAAGAAMRATATSFGYRLAVLKPTAVFGPGQDPARKLGAVSVFASRLLDGETIEVYGSLDTRRDFLHVDDLADLVRRCIEIRLDGEFDVGGPEDMSLGELIAFLEQVTGLAPDVEVIAGSGLDLPTVHLDNSRVTAATGWRPTRKVVQSLAAILRDQIGHREVTERTRLVLARLDAAVR